MCNIRGVLSFDLAMLANYIYILKNVCAITWKSYDSSGAIDADQGNVLKKS